MSFIRDALNGKDAIFIHLCWWIVVDVLLYVGIHMLICSRLWNNCTDSEWAVLQMSYALWKLAYVYMVLTVQRARTVLFSIMCPFSAYFREAEEMTFIWHMSVLWREFVSLRLGLCVCQWYYCKSFIPLRGELITGDCAADQSVRKSCPATRNGPNWGMTMSDRQQKE